MVLDKWIMGDGFGRKVIVWDVFFGMENLWFRNLLGSHGEEYATSNERITYWCAYRTGG
jgi:hypothetical protein